MPDSGKKKENVRSAWTAYLDHLCTKFTQENAAIWNVRQDEIFVELLYQMAVALNYSFDRTHIKNSAYSPVAHGNLEQEQMIIRTALVNLLTKKSALSVVALPADQEEASETKQLRKLMLQCLSGKTPWPISIVEAKETDESDRTQ